MAIPREFNQIRDFVFTKISRDIFDDLHRFVQRKEVNLWAIAKPRGFLKKIMILTLYHDCTSHGYNVISATVDLGFQFSHVSFREDAKRLRPVFMQWGREQVVLGNLREWRRIASTVEIPPDLSDTCLWIDSTDFPREKKSGEGTSSESWSYKENKPALRFMVLQDGQRRIRWFCGGYSPKVYDGHLLTIQREFLARSIKKSVIIADGHFTLGNKIFEEITFHVPIIRVSPGRPKANGEPRRIVPPLTQEQKRYNKKVSRLRSRVESPFAWIKNTFACIECPFREDEYQLECLVIFAFGVHNKMIE